MLFLPRSIRHAPLAALFSLPLSVPAALDCVTAAGRPILDRQFIGLEVTRPHVVRREWRHRWGDPFACSVWEAEKAALEGLDIFARVELDLRDTTDAQGSPGVVLVYRFTELPPWIAAPSVRNTDQDGIFVGPALAAVNLFGEDARVDAFTRFRVDPEVDGAWDLQISASRPWFTDNPYDWRSEIVRWYGTDKTFGWKATIWKLSLDVRHPFRYGLDWTAGFEHMRIDADTSSAVISGGEDDRIWRLTGGLVHDHRDRRAWTRSGGFHELRYERTGGWLWGNGDAHALIADTRWWIPTGERFTTHVTGLLRWREGRMGQYDLALVGGRNSLRGWDLASLRGESEMLGTIEERMTIVGDRSFEFLGVAARWGLQAVAGLDGASTWSDGDFGKRQSLAGAYGGLHVLLPYLDRVRLEAGRGLGDDGYWVVSVGFFEKSVSQRWRRR